MAEICKVEVCVIVDEEGNYAVGVDVAAADERYNEDFSGSMRRVVYLEVDVHCPEPITLVGAAPAERVGEGDLTLRVK